MAAINFPSSPTLNQEFLASNGVTYKWNGVAWVVKAGNKYVQSPVRQTVLTGPVDNKGRADFLEVKPDATKFIVRTKNIDSSTPLILSYGDGFSSIGPKDVIMPITQNLEWELDNNMDNYLYIDLDDSNQGLPLTFGNVTPGKTQIPPTYFVNDNARQEIVRLNPVMTNYTLPYGTMIYSGEYGSTYKAWYVGQETVNTLSWISSAGAFDLATGELINETYIGYDFDKYKIKALEYELSSSYTVIAAPNSPENCGAKSWKLEGSQDGVDWVELDSRTKTDEWVHQTNKRFTITSPGYYRFYRLNILSMNEGNLGYVYVGRFHLFGKPLPKLNPVLVDYNAPFGSVIFSSEHSTTYKAWYIGTGLTDANAWLSANGTFDSDTGEALTPTYVGYDVGENNKVKALKYCVCAGYSSASATGYSYPMWWKLEGSNDLLNWNVLDEQTNVTTWTYQQTKEFNVTTPGFYRYYRLNILQKSFGASHYNYVAIARFELFGDLNNTFFYPIDHRSRGIVCNEDGEYEPRLRIYVGKVKVANSQITEIRSFAYQGLYVSDYFSQAINQITAMAHNIGTSKIDIMIMADLPTSMARAAVASTSYGNAIFANTSASSGSGMMVKADNDCQMALQTFTIVTQTDIAIMAKRAF